MARRFRTAESDDDARAAPERGRPGSRGSGAVRAVPGPPDYPEHRGRRVEWGPWRCVRLLCLPPRSCDGCGSAAEAFTAEGLIHPEPGETVSDTRTRRSRRIPGRTWEQSVERAAQPYRGLSASLCPDCGHLGIYDWCDGFAAVDPTRPTLF